MNLRLARAALAVSLVAAVGLGACSSDKKAAPATSPATTPAGTTPAGTTPASGGSSLTIQSFAFSPNPLTVKAGTPISITNKDGFAHTVSDKGGKFDVQVGGGKSDTLTIADPGTYNIVCHIHASMTGVITVTP